MQSRGKPRSTALAPGTEVQNPRNFPTVSLEAEPPPTEQKETAAAGTAATFDEKGQLCPRTPQEPSKAASPAKKEAAIATTQPETPPTVGQAIFTQEIANRENADLRRQVEVLSNTVAQ